MELDEIRTQKRTRVNKNRNQAQLGQKSEDQYQEDDDDDGEISKNSLTSFHSSRIFRVSRASGGKDRHSKVLTAKGLRDRRVRLSVSTAIQFYDLQDRLGYDQPSKAIEWLINAASDSINELPPLDGAFVDAVKNPVEKRAEMETTYNYIPLNKSSCSSPSETSKGSVLSLSRSEMRVKARERAKNATKEKEKEKENESLLAHRSNTHGSFTELLIIGTNDHNHNNNDSSSFVHKLTRNDYFNQGGFEHPSSKLSNSSGFHHPTQNIVNTPLYPVMAPFCDANAGEQQELQQFFSISDPLIPSTAALGDYNLNFSISPRIAAYNRGTLQSNSPSPLTHLQRLSSSVDMHNVPFLVGATTTSAMSGGENHFPSGFDGRLQLYYDDGCRMSDLKDKGKN